MHFYENAVRKVASIAIYLYYIAILKTLGIKSCVVCGLSVGSLWFVWFLLFFVEGYLFIYYAFFQATSFLS